jgi:hypothetical protein
MTDIVKEDTSPPPILRPLKPEEDLPIVILTPVGSSEPLPESDNMGEIFAMEDCEPIETEVKAETEAKTNNLERTLKGFSPATQKAINSVLNDEFGRMLRRKFGSTEIKNLPPSIALGLGLGKKDKTTNSGTYNRQSSSHRRAHLGNYWCDFCADSIFMHDVSAKARIDLIVKRNRLLDEDNNLINTKFFSEQKPDAHELGVILGLSPSCRNHVASEYNVVYNRYAKGLTPNNMPSFEYVSKELIHQYNQKHYELIGIDINDMSSIRSHQLRSGLQCTKCQMIACPFHRKYSNFDMSNDLCGWCGEPLIDLESLDSSDTIISLDEDIEEITDDDLDKICDCEECRAASQGCQTEETAD